MMKPDAIIVDLDGTICDCSHRVHLLGSIRRERHEDTQPNWDEFNRRCIDDKPIIEVIKIVRWAQASSNTRVFGMTGRSDRYRDQTSVWCASNRIRFDRLFMRRQGDFRSDVDVKTELFLKHISGKYNVLFALDDRDKVVEMWRNLGIRCLQVAKGEY